MNRSNEQTNDSPRSPLLADAGRFGPHNPQLCRVLALLLSYPERSWLAEMPTLRTLVSDLPAPEDDTQRQLLNFMDYLQGAACEELQEAYVAWFDRTRSLSLHLFEHSHGEARERGAAMARLRQLYAECGWELSLPELPDYLPVLCEFSSLAPAHLQGALLDEARPVIADLRERMLERGCPYAAVLAPLLGSTRAVERTFRSSLEEAPQDDLEALDAAWREEPVTFAAGAAHDAREPFVPVDRLTRSAQAAAHSPTSSTT